MNNQRLLIFLLLGAYIFSPSLLTWVIDPNGAWYRPYFIWALLIAAAYLFQFNQQRSDRREQQLDKPDSQPKNNPESPPANQ